MANCNVFMRKVAGNNNSNNVIRPGIRDGSFVKDAHVQM